MPSPSPEYTEIQNIERYEKRIADELQHSLGKSPEALKAALRFLLLGILSPHELFDEDIDYTREKGKTEMSELDLRLREAGYSEDPTDIESQEIAQALLDAGDLTLSKLAARGWIVLFDEEGYFYEDDAHAEIARKLVRATSARDIPIFDRWTSFQGQSGLRVDIGSNTEQIGFFKPTGGDNSKWADVDLIIVAAQTALRVSKSDFLVFVPADDFGCLGVIPHSMAKLFNSEFSIAESNSSEFIRIDAKREHPPR